MKDLFDITKIIFENPEKWKEVTNGEKKKYFFPLQRRFAIQFPMQANALQHLKINQLAVIDFWQNFLKQCYKRTPGWMYTKGIKKAKKIKENKLNVSEKLISIYAGKMNIDKKSVIDALEFFPKDMLVELTKFQKTLN